MDISLVQSLWSRSNVSFVHGGSDGASRGLLTMWDVNKVALLNVYGPQSSVDKDALWISLENLIGSSDVIWVIFGDFNVVRCGEERAGTHFNPREAISFNDFLSRLDLLDFQLGGRRFTRFDKSGSKLSKIDIFLVSHNLFDSWKDASVTVRYRIKHLRMDINWWVSKHLSTHRESNERVIRSLEDWDFNVAASRETDFEINKHEE
ncbi:RNA-directed DNA polymerase, eukaryota [Tanacetum coccineum]